MPTTTQTKPWEYRNSIPDADFDSISQLVFPDSKL